jgi:hypothetical protein
MSVQIGESRRAALLLQLDGTLSDAFRAYARVGWISTLGCATSGLEVLLEGVRESQVPPRTCAGDARLVAIV